MEECKKCGKMKNDDEMDWKHSCRMCLEVYCIECNGVKKGCWGGVTCQRKSHYILCLACIEKIKNQCI
jgi:hypothetical protein